MCCLLDLETGSLELMCSKKLVRLHAKPDGKSEGSGKHCAPMQKRDFITNWMIRCRLGNVLQGQYSQVCLMRALVNSGVPDLQKVGKGGENHWDSIIMHHLFCLLA